MWPGRALEQGAECEWRGAQGSTVFLYMGSRTPVCPHRLGLERDVCVQVLGTPRHSGPLGCLQYSITVAVSTAWCVCVCLCVCVCVCVCVRACVCPAPGV